MSAVFSFISRLISGACTKAKKTPETREKSSEKTARQMGFDGETVACLHLEDNGYEILERNYSCSYGEIDIIARDEEHIIFVEVKTREEGENSSRYGRPALAVTMEKQRKIIYTAKKYMRNGYWGENGMCNLVPRFDVVEIYKNSSGEYVKYRVNHIERAFDLNTAGIKKYR